tara:strand:- start:7731 stop:7901 length:171 start_codon:yes stop_codon:yes gene_type:complete
MALHLGLYHFHEWEIIYTLILVMCFAWYINKAIFNTDFVSRVIIFDKYSDLFFFGD